jgi:transposase-like protein
MAEVGQADRRNGCYTRWLLTELGTIELAVPRTRTFSALKVVRAYTRASQGRRSHDPRLLSARALDLQVAIALLPILGWPVSPVTVSAVAKQLNAALAVFHRRPLKGGLSWKSAPGRKKSRGHLGEGNPNWVPHRRVYSRG